MLSAASRTRILLDDAFRKRGISYDPAVETDSVEAIKQYVAGGAGIPILPDIDISPGDAAELDILPLPNLLAEEVVGVVTRKATGLTPQFDELLASFDANIKAFEAVQGSVGLSGIDVFQVLTITQIQMKSVAAEISRSANVGIGYAYSLKKVRSSLTALGVL